MKRFLFVLTAIVSVSLLASCASSKVEYGQSATAMAKKAGAPEWYFKGNDKDDKGIYAVGRSNFSDVIVAEKAARVDGRAALAQMVQSAVNYMADNNTSASTETVKSFKEQSKVISNQILVGSQQVDRFDLDGVVSVLMFQPYDDLYKNFKSQMMKQDNEGLKNFMSQLTQDQFIDALGKSSAE